MSSHRNSFGDRAPVDLTTCQGSTILSTFDISPSNMKQYWIQCERKKPKTLFGPRIHRRHPIPRPCGRAMGRLFRVRWRRDTSRYRECIVIFPAIGGRRHPSGHGTHNDNVIITSKRHLFDVIMTSLLRRYFESTAVKAPVTLYRDPTAIARRFEISQSAVGSHENIRK